MYVHAYACMCMFYWILVICQPLSCLIPWEVSINTNPSLHIWEVRLRSSETCLKCHSSTLTDRMRNQVCLSPEASLLTTISSFISTLLIVHLPEQLTREEPKFKRLMAPLVSQSHWQISPRKGWSYCCYKAIDSMNPYLNLRITASQVLGVIQSLTHAFFLQQTKNLINMYP